MSFATDTKNELARNLPEKKCCTLAEIAGFIRVAGSIRLKGFGKFLVVINTENPAVARHFKKMIQDYFDIETKLEIGQGSSLNKGHQYSITIGHDNKSEQILRETGILQVKEGYDIFTDGIYEGIIRKKCCKKAYLKGMFMGAGSINNPEKGYNLEIVCGTQLLASDLRKMINTFVDLSCKINPRKGKFVVYMKNFNYISDTLAIMGAHSKVLELQDTKIKKEMKSEATRMVNCDSANIDRATAAAEKAVASIKKIDRVKGLDFLPQKLRQVAELRLAHPEVNLSQLGEMCQPPVQKSGICKRINKIIEIAEDL